MPAHNYIILRVNRIRKFLLNPFFFIIVSLLLVGISIAWYQSQLRHALPPQDRRTILRENLDDISKIVTITGLFFAVFNWLTTSDIAKKKSSLEAVEQFKTEYDNFRKKQNEIRKWALEIGIDKKLTYQESKPLWKNDEDRCQMVEEMFDSILNSCEVLCIEINYGVIDESMVETCLIGAFLTVVEWLLEYIEEKQYRHPGRWINCLETVFRWHKQKSTFDIQAMIEKTRFETLIDSIRVHQMLSGSSEKTDVRIPDAKVL